LTFRILGPPLSIIEDTSYAQAGDPKSAYTHRIANGTYDTLWNRGTFGAENVVRVTRYIIRNPHSTPVQVRIDNPGTFAMPDRWSREVWQWSQPYWRGFTQIQPSYTWTIGPGSSCFPQLLPDFPCGTSGQHLTMYTSLWAPDWPTMDCFFFPAPTPASGGD